LPVCLTWFGGATDNLVVLRARTIGQMPGRRERGGGLEICRCNRACRRGVQPMASLVGSRARQEAFAPSLANQREQTGVAT